MVKSLEMRNLSWITLMTQCQCTRIIIRERQEDQSQKTNMLMEQRKIKKCVMEAEILNSLLPTPNQIASNL